MGKNGTAPGYMEGSPQRYLKDVAVSRPLSSEEEKEIQGIQKKQDVSLISVLPGSYQVEVIPSRTRGHKKGLDRGFGEGYMVRQKRNNDSM